MTNTTNLTTFQFDQAPVRVITGENGEPLFCGKDVATILGYKRTSNALQQHCKGAAIQGPLETGGGTQQVRFITEGDLYRLIVGSKLPAAERFEKWVFEDVLPAVRKHGGYLTPQKLEDALLNPDVLIRLATDLKTERAKRVELEEKVEQDRPKVIFADAVSASKSTCLVGELAKMLAQNGVEIGQNRLFEKLRESGWLISRKGADWNMPSQKSIERGLFTIKETAITHSDGHVTVSRTPKVTGAGQTYFINKFLTEDAA